MKKPYKKPMIVKYYKNLEIYTYSTWQDGYKSGIEKALGALMSFFRNLIK